jgi:hypothetical protein
MPRRCMIETRVGTDQLGQTCWTLCQDDAHVVLFAVGGDFAGHRYQPGEHMLVCLRHGGDILEARRVKWEPSTIPGGGTTFTAPPGVEPSAAPASWMWPYLDRLPVPRLPSHTATAPIVRPHPWTPPARRVQTGADLQGDTKLRPVRRLRADW